MGNFWEAEKCVGALHCTLKACTAVFTPKATGNAFADRLRQKTCACAWMVERREMVMLVTLHAAVTLHSEENVWHLCRTLTNYTQGTNDVTKSPLSSSSSCSSSASSASSSHVALHADSSSTCPSSSSALLSQHPYLALFQCFAVFISNKNKSVPLWGQRAGASDNEHLVIWDYHGVYWCVLLRCLFL